MAVVTGADVVMAIIEGRIRWLASTAVAIGAVGSLMLLFRLPEWTPLPKPMAKHLPSVQMARPTEADVVLKDEALIRDLRPLFLPTEFNATLPEPRREPGRSILDDEKLRSDFSDSELGLSRDLPPVATLNGKSAHKARGTDLLAAGEVGVGLVGFGRGNRAVEPLEPRGGFVEVVAVSSGRTVLAESLPVAFGPVGGKAWEPMELFAAVDTAGLASPLVVTEGSRVEEIDAHFRKVLAQTFRIGERLPPGFYRIVVGP